MSNLKGISMSSSKLLLAAKALSTDPAAPNLKTQLAAAARSAGAGMPKHRVLGSLECISDQEGAWGQRNS